MTPLYNSLVHLAGPGFHGPGALTLRPAIVIDLPGPCQPAPAGDGGVSDTEGHPHRTSSISDSMEVRVCRSSSSSAPR